MTQRDDGLDRFVEDLQREVNEQARAVYSVKVIEEASYPDRVGRMESPDAYGRSMGWCGDMVELYRRLDGARVIIADFRDLGVRRVAPCHCTGGPCAGGVRRGVWRRLHAGRRGAGVCLRRG